MKTNYGPLKMKYRIKQEFDVDVSTTIIYRFYKKKMLIRKPQRKLPWYEPMQERLIVAKPGEGVQFDIKYIYPDGKRKYLFSVFDPYTEQYYFWIADTKHSYQAITAFKCAEEYFDFKILSVQTDNGSEFVGSWQSLDDSAFTKTVCSVEGLVHRTIPPGAHTWQADVETTHRIIEDEFYEAQKFQSREHFLQQASQYALWFNTIRKNSWKQFKTPWEIAHQRNPEISPLLPCLPALFLDEAYFALENDPIRGYHVGTQPLCMSTSFPPDRGSVCKQRKAARGAALLLLQRPGGQVPPRMGTFSRNTILLPEAALRSTSYTAT